MGSLAALGERKKGGGSSGRWWEEKREPSILKIFYLDKSKWGKRQKKIGKKKWIVVKREPSILSLRIQLV